MFFLTSSGPPDHKLCTLIFWIDVGRTSSMGQTNGLTKIVLSIWTAGSGANQKTTIVTGIIDQAMVHSAHWRLTFHFLSLFAHARPHSEPRGGALPRHSARWCNIWRRAIEWCPIFRCLYQLKANLICHGAPPQATDPRGWAPASSCSFATLCSCPIFKALENEKYWESAAELRQENLLPPPLPRTTKYLLLTKIPASTQTVC